jgi:U6 snRNA-associated Sm-like protein LSm8
VEQGILKGFDQTINLIIDDSHERVFSSSQGVEQVQLGLHIIRGDNVYVSFTYCAITFSNPILF